MTSDISPVFEKEPPWIVPKAEAAYGAASLMRNLVRGGKIEGRLSERSVLVDKLFLH
jgi:hypothetical protein